jgi:uncharacterized protein (TIGR00255 family)
MSQVQIDPQTGMPYVSPGSAAAAAAMPIQPAITGAPQDYVVQREHYIFTLPVEVLPGNWKRPDADRTFALTPLSVAEILRWPGVLADDSLSTEQLQAEGMGLFAGLLDEFVASRNREGAKLADVLRERAVRMREQVAAVSPLVPLALAAYQERIAAKLREAVANLDEDRIRQEIGVFAAKIDVAEELARLSTHLDELERVLKKGGAVGKRLDFLMQELNREANTLSSKSVSSEVTVIALELKLLIEQMREQVQNLE